MQEFKKKYKLIAQAIKLNILDKFALSDVHLKCKSVYYIII